jgi:hypothetical protein
LVDFEPIFGYKGDVPMPSTVQRNALDFLRHDHRRLKDLFDAFEESDDLTEQKGLADTLIRELEAHLQTEESVLYAAIKEAAGAHHSVVQAEEEHQEIRDVIVDLQEFEPEDPLFVDKLIELETKVRHHLQEEEAEVFSQAEEANLDLERLGREMQEMRASLTPPVVPSSGPAKSKRRNVTSRKR